MTEQLSLSSKENIWSCSKNQNSPTAFREEVLLIASLKIEVELVYSVPAVQQNNSVIYIIYIYVLDSFPS